MNAASIIETFGRGIPATLDTSMIVDVCAYLRSTQSPAVLVLNSRGEMKGVLSHRDIIHASGRLGSSVMQMMAQELMRDQVPVCQSGDGLIELLELVTETGSDFALVAEGSQIKGIVSSHDLTELLVTALGGGDAEAQTAEAAVEPAQPMPQEPVQIMPQEAQPQPQPQPQPQAMTEAPVWQPQPQPPAQPVQEQAQPQVLAMPQQLQPAPPAGQAGGWQPQVQYQALAEQPVHAAPAPQPAPWPSPYPSVPDVPPAAAFAQPGQPAPLPSHHAEGAGMHQLQPQSEQTVFQTQLQPQQQQQAQPQQAAPQAAWATFSS